MRSEDIAANIDPITRQYIGLVVQEALIPSMNELWESLERIRASIVPTPDTSDIERRIEKTVTDQLSAALASLVQRNVAVMREEFRIDIENLKSQLSYAQEVDASLRKLVDDLDMKIKRWAEEDRYTITRAQVLKVMRESGA